MLKALRAAFVAWLIDLLFRVVIVLVPRRLLAEASVEKNAADFRFYVELLRIYVGILRKLQMLDAHAVEQLQSRRLRRIVRAACATRWWQQYFEENSVDARMIFSTRDLVHLPPINRTQIADVPKDALQRRSDDSTIVWRRSGGSTTGTPITWGLERSSLIIDNLANVLRVFEDTGFRFDQVSRVNFYISFNYPHPAERTDFMWFAARDVRVRVAHDSYEPDFEQKICEMNSLVNSLHGNAVIRLNPAELRFLTQEFRERHLRPRVGAFLVVGNVLEPAVRSFASDYFACPIHAYYGTQEFGSAGIECVDAPGSYHVLTERVIVEILDDDGKRVPLEREGHVTVTCLDSAAMPLLRYQPGDIGSLSPAKCSCNNKSPLLTIHRRTNEIIKYPSGKTASATYILRYFNRDPFVSTVRRFQVKQKTTEEVDISLEVRGPLPGAALKSLEENLRAVYGTEINFCVSEVAALEERGAKFKVFIPLTTENATSARGTKTL